MGCSYCNKLFTEELWCNECDTCIMKGWTSGNLHIDNFIKDTMCNIKNKKTPFLEWVPFDRFTDIRQVGEGGFAKVFSATWLDGKSYYDDDDKSLILGTGPIKVALKRLDESQNMSEKYLNEVLVLVIFGSYIHILFILFN